MKRRKTSDSKNRGQRWNYKQFTGKKFQTKDKKKKKKEFPQNHIKKIAGLQNTFVSSMKILKKK